MSDDKQIIFSMSGVSKILPHNNKAILKDIYLSFFYGAKIGILGLNGSGKSTLLKIIAGIDQSYRGDVAFSPGYSVGYLEQEPQLDESKTVLEIVKEGMAETTALLEEYNQINEDFALPENYEDAEKMEKMMARQAELQDRIDASNAWELDTVLDRAMDALQCPPPDSSIAVLSGGERRRVALCRLLLQNPDILLLDEPTNHLDMLSVGILVQALQQYEGTFLAVSHDRHFIKQVANKIWWIEDQELKEYPGTYDEYEWWMSQRVRPEKRLSLPEKEKEKEKTKLVKPKLETVSKSDIAAIEQEIQAQETLIKNLEEAMGAPEIYQDLEKLTAINRDCEQAKAQVVSLTERWEILIMELD